MHFLLDIRADLSNAIHFGHRGLHRQVMMARVKLVQLLNTLGVRSILLMIHASSYLTHVDFRLFLRLWK